jgi:hypothetical protein
VHSARSFHTRLESPGELGELVSKEDPDFHRDDVVMGGRVRGLHEIPPYALIHHPGESRDLISNVANHRDDGAGERFLSITSARRGDPIPASRQCRRVKHRISEARAIHAASRRLQIPPREIADADPQLIRSKILSGSRLARWKGGSVTSRACFCPATVFPPLALLESRL